MSPGVTKVARPHKQVGWDCYCCVTQAGGRFDEGTTHIGF